MAASRRTLATLLLAWLAILITGLITLQYVGPAITGKVDGKKHLQPFVKPEVDLMFVLDITGSTGAAWSVASCLSEFVAKTEHRFNLHFGLTVFRDEMERVPSDREVGIEGDPWMFRFASNSAYTADWKELRAVLTGIRDDGGRDVPENSLEALRVASQGNGRASAQKVLVLVTDAPPKIDPNAETAFRLTNAAFAKEKVHFVYLVVPNRFHQEYRGLVTAKKTASCQVLCLDYQFLRESFSVVLDSIRESLEKEFVER